jgi:hypothetical protein
MVNVAVFTPGGAGSRVVMRPPLFRSRAYGPELTGIAYPPARHAVCVGAVNGKERSEKKSIKEMEFVFPALRAAWTDAASATVVPNSGCDA